MTEHPPEFHAAFGIKPDDERTPVEVIRDFTKSWVDGMADLADQLNGLMAQAFREIKEEEDDLCRWGDEGGYCP